MSENTCRISKCSRYVLPLPAGEEGMGGEGHELTFFFLGRGQIQDYQRQIQANDIITQDQIHNLFLNLNSLADFQRRFLIGVEANASQPFENQRFGNLFLQMVTFLPGPHSHFFPLTAFRGNLQGGQLLSLRTLLRESHGRSGSRHCRKRFVVGTCIFLLKSISEPCANPLVHLRN